jgi:hypothetical protein
MDTEMIACIRDATTHPEPGAKIAVAGIAADRVDIGRGRRVQSACWERTR